MKRCKSNSNKEQGMTFIEVLVALVIMVTGILGAVAMQATAKKGSFDAMQRSLASSLAQDIIERMRSNDATLLASYAGADYGAVLGVSVPACSSVAGCTSENMIINDIYEWERALMGADVKSADDKNSGGLVDTRACITVNGSAVDVVITWQGREKLVSGNTESCGSTDSQRRQVLVEAFVY